LARSASGVHVIATVSLHDALPIFTEQEQPIYSDQSFVLASATFFKQDFYTARYIYGFGRTEDVAYGHNISLTAGWARNRGIARRSEEHTSELQSRENLVCRLLHEK